jgi:broad specificity phosphatase PhoE
MEPLKLLFIRHAQSTGNQQRRMQGHGDFELSAEGKIQAEKLAKRLLTEFCHPAFVYSSPLRRAAQTAEILLAHVPALLPVTASVAMSDLVNGKMTSPVDGLGAKPKLGSIAVEYAGELQEFQNGVFQGLTWLEAKARYPDLCSRLEASPDWIQIPGAESLRAARARAHRFIHTLLERHENGQQIWIVTHSWILQHLIAELLGCDRSWRIHAHNTALFEFWIDRSRWQKNDQNRLNTDLWQIRRFNDDRHLSP